MVSNATRVRCAWPGTDPQYVEHHDREWGVPVHDARTLWEHLVLDGFQAGLSWLLVLRKREGFRRAFAGMNPQQVARFGERDVARLLGDAGIIRSRAKIESAIGNARAYVAMLEQGADFGRWVWSFVDGVPIQGSWRTQAEVPSQTRLSEGISKELKSRGFRFVGPTTTYAWMQAVGLVNDHVTSCFRHEEVKQLALRGGTSSGRRHRGRG